MTTDDSGAPPVGVLAYKLALAILGQLQEKGLLSDAEVERVLVAAKRSASQPASGQHMSGQSAPDPAAPPLLDLDLSEGGAS